MKTTILDMLNQKLALFVVYSNVSEEFSAKDRHHFVLPTSNRILDKNSTSFRREQLQSGARLRLLDKCLEPPLALRNSIAPISYASHSVKTTFAPYLPQYICRLISSNIA